ncbi:MAG: response regulator transcription factor [Oscillospiraceae bacterium]|nr:response regulator transcription factor [Oscillospiraceae bacterium]
MYNILVCDDEKDIVAALKIYLTAEGYQVLEAGTGREALDILDRERVDLVLMDIMMPEMDGLSAVAKLREQSNIPVLFLTAKSEDTDMILGLNIGGDDYITKPFNPVELIARVRSHLRRYMKLGGVEQKQTTLQVGGIALDDDSKQVTVDGEEVALTPLEYSILKFLMQSPGKVFSSAEIYRNVWKDTWTGSENTVAVHIRHLREKLEIDPANPRYLKVVWGHGYKIEEAVK